MYITVATRRPPDQQKEKRLPKQTLDHKHKHEQTSSKICTSMLAGHQTTTAGQAAVKPSARLYLALTIGTLLSSQRTDALRVWPFDLPQGNLIYIT